MFLCQFAKAFGFLLPLEFEIVHKSKEIGLELQVVGFDAVGSEVLAGPLEDLPKRTVIAGIRELKKFGTRVLLGALGVFR
jgi:hypothetical protein